MNADSPEELLSVFKAAALSVTKLYKTSATAQAKARADGYQDCLDDLLAYLDKEAIGLGDGDGWKIRRWATERLDGRETVAQTVESEDEVDKAETVSSPELHRTNSPVQTITASSDVAMRNDSAPPPSVQPIITEDAGIVVPSQEVFTFQSRMPYPQDSNLTLANLDLGDGRPPDASQRGSIPSITMRTSKMRHNNGPKSGSRSYQARASGQKRKLNLPEIFDIGSFGIDKEVFGGRASKRNRLG